MLLKLGFSKNGLFGPYVFHCFFSLLGIVIGTTTFVDDTIHMAVFYPYSKTVPWIIAQWNRIFIVQLGDEKKIHN